MQNESSWHKLFSLPGVTWMGMLKEWYSWRVETDKHVRISDEFLRCFCLAPMLDETQRSLKRTASLRFDRTHVTLTSRQIFPFFAALRSMRYVFELLFQVGVNPENIDHPFVRKFAPLCKSMEGQWQIVWGAVAIHQEYKELIASIDRYEMRPDRLQAALVAAMERVRPYFEGNDQTDSLSSSFPASLLSSLELSGAQTACKGNPHGVDGGSAA